MTASTHSKKPAGANADEYFMQAAIAEAQKGLGRTRPNPAVGAVIVRHGRIIATGYHHAAGQAHAEVEALNSVKGALDKACLYVTLEPCNHVGRTGPCTERILQSGLRQVVVGCQDPNPAVQGAGIARLRAAGIEVRFAVLEEQCRELNRGYCKHITTGLPYTILKAAVSLDGRLATRSGDSKGLSGPQSQAHLHALRARCDAIMVGVGTVLADNPRLTARPAESSGESASALIRVVVDTHARTPPNALVIGSDAQCIIAVGRNAASRRLACLRAAGAEIVICREKQGKVALKDLLQRLGRKGLMTVLVEGGGHIHGALLRDALADAAMIYVTPRLIGGDGVPLLAGKGRATIKAAALKQPRWTALGDDMLLEALL